MGAVDGLGFDRGVPPRVQNEDVFGSGEVEPHAAGLEADQEDLQVRVFLELLDHFLAVAGLAVEVGVADAQLVQAFADQAQHAGELRKHQRLLPAVDDVGEHVAEGVELGRRHVRPAGVDALLVDQRGVAGGLPQPQQGFEHHERVAAARGAAAACGAGAVGGGFVVGRVLAGPGRTVFRDRVELLHERAAVVGTQLVIHLALGRLHLAQDGLLGLGGQVFEHFGLGAAQDERAQGPGHLGDGVGGGGGVAGQARAVVGQVEVHRPHLGGLVERGVGRGVRVVAVGQALGGGVAAGGLDQVAEPGAGAQHAGVEELEDRPQVAQVVLDRGAGEGQAVVGLQQTCRFRTLAGGVLNGLRFVEHGVVELHFFERVDVAPHQPEAGDDQVLVFEVFDQVAAVWAAVSHDLELGAELLGLIEPVKDDRAGHDDERGLGGRHGLGVLGARAGRVAVDRVAVGPAVHHGQHLDGLAQAHVVGQDAAHAEGAQELQPAQAFALVGPQGAAKAFGGVGGVDAVEGLEFLAGLGKTVVDRRVVLAGQQLVEHRGLAALEAQVVAFDLAQGHQQAVLVEPLLGQQRLGAVAQHDHVFARPRGGQDLGQGQGFGGAVGTLVGGFATQLKPVDAGGDRQRRRAGGADGLLVGRDDPAGAQQAGDRTRHLLGRNQQHVAGGAGGVPQAQAGGGGDRLTLGAEVAANQLLLAVQGLDVGTAVGGRIGVGRVVVDHRGLGVGRLRVFDGADGGGHETAAAGGADALAGVVEAHAGDQAVAARAGQQLGGLRRAGAVDVKVRDGVEHALGAAQALGQVQLGQLGQQVKAFKEAFDVGLGHPQGRDAHRGGAGVRVGVVAAFGACVGIQGRGVHVLTLVGPVVGVAVVAELADPAKRVAVVEGRGGGHGVARACVFDRAAQDDQPVAPAQHDIGFGDGDALAGAAQLHVDEQLAGARPADEPQLPGGGAVGPAQGALAAFVDVGVFFEFQKRPAGADHAPQDAALGPGGDAVGVVAAVQAVGLVGFVAGDPGGPEHHAHQLAVGGVGQVVDGVQADLQRLGFAPAAGDGGALLQVDDQPAVALREVGQHDVTDLPLGGEDRDGVRAFGGLGVFVRRRPQQREPPDPARLGGAHRAQRVVALAGFGRPQAQLGQVADRRAAHALVVVALVGVEVQQRRPDVQAELALGHLVTGAVGRGVASVAR